VKEENHPKKLLQTFTVKNFFVLVNKMKGIRPLARVIVGASI